MTNEKSELRRLARTYVEARWADIDNEMGGDKKYDGSIARAETQAFCALRDAVFTEEELAEQSRKHVERYGEEYTPADGEQWAWGERPADGTPPSRDEGQSKRFATVEELMADLNADDWDSQ